MALKDRIASDRARVFINPDHFADEHDWNGTTFLCVVDEDAALKRKNNNVNDISWDNNTIDVMIYVREEDFPGRAIPNEAGYFDRKMMRILQVQNDMGMLTIVMTRKSPKALANTDWDD